MTILDWPLNSQSHLTLVTTLQGIIVLILQLRKLGLKWSELIGLWSYSLKMVEPEFVSNVFALSTVLHKVKNGS